MNILITGGLGFIGVNSAIYFHKKGYKVFILDNISRKGNMDNYDYLSSEINFTFFSTDIRNYFSIEEIFKKNKFDVVLHLAAQVAVTTSVLNPREDYEINSTGTFNILECIRIHSPNTSIIYASTNKVYGESTNELEEKNTRYSSDLSIDETKSLDFHSPYGCSKGSADQYVRDYNRIYNIKSVVLRQSCIYGPNQFGIEDQGWVSWFSIASLFDKEITIYGNGKQVRDVLHVFDLIELYDNVIHNINICSGNVYNIGGGIKNTLSILELVKLLTNILDKDLNIKYADWRPGDQKYYVSNIQKIKDHIGWSPKISPRNGIDLMMSWIDENKNLFRKLKLV